MKTVNELNKKKDENKACFNQGTGFGGGKAKKKKEKGPG